MNDAVFARASVTAAFIAAATVGGGCGGTSAPTAAPVSTVAVASVASVAPVGSVTSPSSPSAADSDACLVAMMGTYNGPPPPGCTLDRSDIPPVDLSDAGLASADAGSPAPPLRGSMTIAGHPSVPVANFDRIVAGLRARLRACYRTALIANPALPAGRAVMRLHIEPNGETSQVTVTAPTVFPPPITACLKRTVGNAQFDPPGGKGADATIEGTFAPD